MSDVLREPLVLPGDVLIVPVADLPHEVRAKLGDDGEEFAITRPLAREPSKLIDAAAAQLIEQFREPQTIVQAVLSYSRNNETDPETTLEESFSLLCQMLKSGLLLPAEAEDARRIEATYTSGDAAGSYRVVRCVQTLDDSELYQAHNGSGNLVALKIARKERALWVKQRLESEIVALGRLDGVVSPKLIDHGAIEGRPFIATEWISGTNARTAAADLRGTNDHGGLLRCIVEIVRAYAAIHQRGVLHGDVHPGNILIGREGNVTLIDFGQAQIVDGPSDGSRGGVSFFMEPEYAQAILEQRHPPQVTAQSEQFAVAALLYVVVTGQHYMDFTLLQKEMLGQIRDAQPLPFELRGIDPWPKLEAVLARALAVLPADRFPDMISFAETLANIMPPPKGAPAIQAVHGGTEWLKSTLDYVGLDGGLYRDRPIAGPLCSVNFGASGIAYALHRIACQRDDPRLLAAADAWIMRAQAEAESETAFYNPVMEMTEATIGRVSLYHGRPGLNLVHAIIADAKGEHAARDAAIRAFLTSSEIPSLERDLTLGRSGMVLGCAILLERLPTADSLWDHLHSSGQRRLNELWAEVAKFDSISCGKDWPNLGIAHGWAGLVYLTWRWHEVTGEAIPASAQDRLDQLIGAASPNGRGLTWSWRHADSDPGSMPGWCNGSAGMVHLFCLAHRLVGDDRLLEVAEGAAWHAWDAGGGPADLCCGYAGRAYALLELYRATADVNWLERAQVLGERAVQIAPQVRGEAHPRHSLYKGELGLALLLSDLEEPGRAAMPLFGSERWS